MIAAMGPVVQVPCACGCGAVLEIQQATIGQTFALVIHSSGSLMPAKGHTPGGVGIAEPAAMLVAALLSCSLQGGK